MVNAFWLCDKDMDLEQRRRRIFLMEAIKRQLLPKGLWGIDSILNQGL